MIYNVLILLGVLIALPKWLLARKYRGTLCQRLGLKMPHVSKAQQVIWIHMVSVGETRAMIPIVAQLRQQYPDADLYFSSATKAGQQEARRSLLGGADYFFLPIDLSWIMRRLVHRLKPDVLLLSESDFWLNMMREVKRQKGRVILLNGKISERSLHRFSHIPSRVLFAQIDRYLVQNAIYAARFAALKVDKKRIAVTGNLKLAVSATLPTQTEKGAFCSRFGIGCDQPIVTLASTHQGEEELLIPQIPRAYTILLAARHPERFDGLKARYGSDPRVIVIDEMGILLTCFCLSQLAIVGGSFLPGIGGHNVFEPIQVGIPVIFGPFCQTQSDLVEVVLKGGAGMQTEAKHLDQAIAQALLLKANAHQLAHAGEKVLQETIEALDLKHLLG